MERLLSVREIAEGDEYPFTEGQLRMWLFHRKKNGLQRAVRKPSPRRLYLVQDEFDRWLEESAESVGEAEA